MALPEGDREAMKGFLASRDTPCPGCGYNLRGLAADWCPECSRPLQLGVMSSDDGSLSLAIATAGLTAMGTTAAFFLAGIAAFSMQRGWPTGEEFTFLVFLPAVIVLVDAVAALAFLRQRRWFLRLSSRGRLCVVFACWVVSVCGFVGWLAAVLFNF